MWISGRVWVRVRVRVMVMVMVAVCLKLKSAVSAKCLASSTHENETDIYILGISISNDLPPGPPSLFLTADFQKKEVEITHRNRYIKLLSPDDHSGKLRWKQCAAFSVIPASEQGHQRIYWSARENGLYHSWDAIVWQKKVSWGSC